MRRIRALLPSRLRGRRLISAPYRCDAPSRGSFRIPAAPGAVAPGAAGAMRGIAMLLLCLVAGVVVVVVVGDGVSNPGPPNPQLVLLLDSSASMASQNRIEKMRVAVRGWVESLVPEGVTLSLWKFTNDAEEVKSVLIDTSPTSRQEIINHIPDGTSGSSCISCAIETVLKHVNKKAIILLITDGNDKFLKRDIENLINNLAASQCKIISILIGNSPMNMNLLYELSEGSVNHVTDDNAVLGLLDALQAAALTAKNYTASINIFEEEFSSSESHFHSTFSIDSSLVEHSVCINLYYWPHEMALDVNLTTPNNDSQYMLDIKSKSGYMKFCPQHDMVGEWRTNIFSPTFNKFIALQITANKIDTDMEANVRFNCWAEMGKNTLSLCGELLRGKYSISNTKISVDIIAEDGEITKQNLIQIYPGSDDIQPQEYLYVRKHLNVNESGYYSARCWAEGQLVNAYNTTIKHQHFVRVGWVGTFMMDKMYLQPKIPTRIKDLNIVQNLDMLGCVLILEFTAPSDALKYKLMLSLSLYDIVSANGLTLSTVPGAANTKEKIVFTVPSRYQISLIPLYIGINAVGNSEESEISNIVQVKCQTNKTKLPLSEANQKSSVSTSSTPPVGAFNGSLIKHGVHQETLPNTKISNSSIISARQDNLSTTVATHRNNVKSLTQEDNSSSLTTTPVFNTGTSSTRRGHDKNVTSIIQIYNINTTPTITVNAIDIYTDPTNTDDNYISVIKIVGIVLGVCLVIAVIGKLLHHIIYTHRRYGTYVVSDSQSIQLKTSTSNVRNHQQT